MTANGNSGGGVNPVAAFAAVMRPAAPLPLVRSLVVANETMVEFIDACDSALCCGPPTVGELLPGIDVEQPAAMLKAYLLLLANEGLMSEGESIDVALVKSWHARVTPRVWTLLGFAHEPGLLQLQLAFSLHGRDEHIAGELRAFFWAVGEFAAIGLMPGLRA